MEEKVCNRETIDEATFRGYLKQIEAVSILLIGADKYPTYRSLSDLRCVTLFKCSFYLVITIPYLQSHAATIARGDSTLSK
jgi:hypothetical protein